MSPLLSYAVKSLRRNKLRTLVTIIGVAMSSALIVALATAGTSIYNYLREGYIAENGDWHIGVNNASLADVESICAKPDVTEPFMAVSIGYAQADTVYNEKPYLYLQGVNDEYYRHMPVSVVEGRIPSDDNEIMLPESFIKAAQNAWKLNDTMTLDVGLRLDGEHALWQYNPYNYGYDMVSFADKSEESLQQLCTMTYTVVGIYKTNAPEGRNDEPGYTALTWWQYDASGSKNALSYDAFPGGSNYNRTSLWFRLNNVSNAVFHDIYDSIRLEYGYNIVQIPQNLNLLSLSGVRISAKGEIAGAVAIAAALLLIVLAGSVMLIYNVFAISIGERTKQFGLLSSIGATKKQIRQSVIYEAAIVSGFGVLAGIFLGIALVQVLLIALGSIVKNVFGFAQNIHLYVWFPALAAAAVIAVLTVLVSALIPAKRAARITAIDAIRQSGEFKLSKKTKKVPGIVEKLFGFEGALAVTYYRRSKKRYRITTIALFLSMVLFVSVNTFSDYVMVVVNTEYKTQNYDIYVTLQSDQPLTDKEKDHIRQRLSGLENVSAVTQSDTIFLTFPTEENENCMTEDFKEASSGYMSGNSQIVLSPVDDASFESFCREHELDPELYMDPEHPALIVNNQFKSMNHKNGRIKIIEGLKKEADKIRIDIPQSGTTEFNVGYFAESLAPGCNGNWYLSAMIPESVAANLGIRSESENSQNYFLVTSAHRETADEVEGLLFAYPESSVYDQAERQSGNTNLVFMLRLLSNVFIIMIAVISVANVFNTISTNLLLRKKEFAMLKTVGMTQHGLYRMINLECLIYGGKSVLYGLPVSIITALVMHHFFTKDDVVFAFRMPAGSILIAVGCIFAVVFTTMLYAIRRIKRENVIDVLKQENF